HSGLRQALRSCGEGVLELVVGQVLRVAVVSFGRQIEEGLALLVVGQALVHDLPADGLAVLDRGEAVAEPWCVGTIAAKRPELLAPVRMVQAEAVASRLCKDAGRLSVRLQALDKPVASLEPEHLPGLEWLVRRVRMNSLRPGPSVGDHLVPEGRARAHPGS